MGVCLLTPAMLEFPLVSVEAHMATFVTWCKNNNLKLRVSKIKTLWWTALLQTLYTWCCKKLQTLKRFTHMFNTAAQKICTISIVRKTPRWEQFSMRSNNQICPSVSEEMSRVTVKCLCEMMSFEASWIRMGVFSESMWTFCQCWRNWLEAFLRYRHGSTNMDGHNADSKA